MTTSTQGSDYSYFVSYVITNPHGYGCTSVRTGQPISTWDDISGLTNFIAQAAGGPVVVLNYQLLSGPTVPHNGK